MFGCKVVRYVYIWFRFSLQESRSTAKTCGWSRSATRSPPFHLLPPFLLSSSHPPYPIFFPLPFSTLIPWEKEKGNFSIDGTFCEISFDIIPICKSSNRSAGLSPSFFSLVCGRSGNRTFSTLVTSMVRSPLPSFVLLRYGFCCYFAVFPPLFVNPIICLEKPFLRTSSSSLWFLLALQVMKLSEGSSSCASSAISSPITQVTRGSIT